jgi:hypothetical protein
MWTDFSGGDLRATETAQGQMNDSRVMCNPDQTHFSSADAVALHKKLRVESAELIWQGPKRSARGYQLSCTGHQSQLQIEGRPSHACVQFPEHGGDHWDPPVGPVV